MRKISANRKAWLDNKTQRVANAKRVAASLRKQKKRRIHARSTLPINRSGRLQLIAPAVITVMNHPGREFLQFLRKMVRAILVQRIPVTLDLSAVRTIGVDGAIVLLAEIDRCLELAKFPQPLSCTSSHSEKANQVFVQIGLYSRLNLKVEITPTFEDVIHWQVAKGKMIERDAEEFIEKFEGTIAPNALVGLAKGIAEALTNCVDHAYLLQNSNGMPHPKVAQWWLFSQERDNWLTVVAYDLGIGFRRSFPETDRGRELLRYARVIRSKVISDERALRIVLQAGQSRTGSHHRGKGIPQIIDVINKCGEGNMYIISHHGMATFIAEKGSTSTKRMKLKEPVQGTIIGWKIPITQ